MIYIILISLNQGKNKVTLEHYELTNIESNHKSTDDDHLVVVSDVAKTHQQSSQNGENIDEQQRSFPVM